MKVSLLLVLCALFTVSTFAATQEDLQEHENLVRMLKFFQPDYGLPYTTEYKNALANYQTATPVSDMELWKTLRTESLILMGDIHTTKLPQKNFLELLQKTFSPQQKTALILEFLPAEMNDIVDAYISNEISESLFIEQINEVRYWPFPMDEYLNILRFAKAHSLSIFLPDSLDRQGSAFDRDQRIIVAAQEALSKFNKVYVFFGTSHFLGKGHLRDGFKKQLNLNPVVIVPDCDELYWKLNLGKRADDSVFMLEEKVFLFSPQSPNLRLKDTLSYYRRSFGFN